MSRQQINILLVEDDEVDIMNVQRALKKNDTLHSLTIARNGIEALKILEREGEEAIPHPRVVLVDINMPKMNGLEFLGKVRSIPRLKKLSVFVLSTSDEERDKEAAFQLNVAGYIQKPLDFTEFVESMKVLTNFWALCEL